MCNDEINNEGGLYLIYAELTNSKNSKKASFY